MSAGNESSGRAPDPVRSLRWREKVGPPIDPARLERILLVVLDNLGDLVFSSALLDPIARAAPRARIDVWCKDYTEPIARLLPRVGRVIAADPFWDRAPGRGKGSFATFVRSLAEVRRGRYELALLASSQWRAALAVRAAGIPLRVGLARHRSAAWLTHALPAADVDRPVLAELGRILGPLGIAPGALAYRLDATLLAQPRARIAEKLGHTAPVALHAFASKLGRCMHLDAWMDLAHALRADGRMVLWIGSPRELAELRARLANAEDWMWSDRLGEDGLQGLAAMLSECAAFVGNDSGPLHVAGALGVPCVGVFAPGQPERTFPQGIGPWRLIARPSPEGLGASDVLPAVRALLAERDDDAHGSV